MANLFRMRIELSAERGALGRLGAALEHVGGSIITIDLQDLDAHRAVDDLVVEFASSALSPATVKEVLDDRHAGVLRSWAPVEQAIDPVLRSIRWACSIFGAGSSVDDELLRVLGEVCASDNVWLMAADDQNLAALIPSRNHRPTVVDAIDLPQAMKPSFDGLACVLVVPDARLSPSVFAVVARPSGETFSHTEADRVSAMLAVYRQTRIAGAGPQASGAWFDVSNM